MRAPIRRDRHTNLFADARARRRIVAGGMQLVLQRELRREARRRRAAVSRLVCSVIGFVAGLFLLLMTPGGADGRRLFNLLTFVGFAFCFIAGVRIAAGTIADEKRDGTLPLLFLTALRPSEIIGGKFFSVAIPLIQPFLAFIPALAITLLYGGVTGTEFFRALDVIASSLFFSIAAGLCVSSFSRRNEISGRSTLSLLAFMLGFPLLIARGKLSFLRFFSAWTAFQSIGDEHNRLFPYDFLAGTLTLQFTAVGLLIAAVYFLPKRWEPVTVAISVRARSRILAICSNLAERLFPDGLPGTLHRALNPQERGEILDRNPGEWLAVRQGINYLEQIPFVAALIILAFAATVAPATGSAPTPAFVATAASVVLLLVRLASQASHPLCNLRRSGAVEMLLSTPLEPLSLVTGQIAALKKQFIVPTIIVLAGAFFYSIRASSGPFAGAFGFLLIAVLLPLWIVCLAAFGMFLGLIENSPASAFFQTIFFGVFIAGPLSTLSAPFPLALLFLLGFSGNRLNSPDLVKLLKRQPRAPKSAWA